MNIMSHNWYACLVIVVYENSYNYEITNNTTVISLCIDVNYI